MRSWKTQLANLLLLPTLAFSPQVVTAFQASPSSVVPAKALRLRSAFGRYRTSSSRRESGQHLLEQATPTAEQQRQDWINKSVEYYSKVMREERRRSLGQVKEYQNPEYQENFTALAARHYFALRKIKDGKLEQAERIYRKIIDQLMADDHECDHAKMAVTTLLLALLLQRMNAPARQTRSVFLTFFRIVNADHDKQCACSAKVVGAFALFEMKQGFARKSLHLAQRAFELDPTAMSPLLHWKQFREADQQEQQRRQRHEQQQRSS